jgi:hypothetical protein
VDDVVAGEVEEGGDDDLTATVEPVREHDCREEFQIAKSLRDGSAALSQVNREHDATICCRYSWT